MAGRSAAGRGGWKKETAPSALGVLLALVRACSICSVAQENTLKLRLGVAPEMSSLGPNTYLAMTMRPADSAITATSAFRTPSESWQGGLQNPLAAAIMASMAKKTAKDNQTPAAVNKKAYHDFELVEKYEAGIELRGSEVKSLRAAAADLTGSYARVEDGECWLVGAKIAAYQQAGSAGHDPTRKRKLLLHKAELHRIQVKLDQRGYTLVPLRMYFTQKGKAKIELALAQGKRQYDKRRTITERAQKRDLDRNMKKYRK
jgi:SsrA-binding protein